MDENLGCQPFFESLMFYRHDLEKLLQFNLLAIGLIHDEGKLTN